MISGDHAKHVKTLLECLDQVLPWLGLPQTTSCIDGLTIAFAHSKAERIAQAVQEKEQEFQRLKRLEKAVAVMIVMDDSEPSAARVEVMKHVSSQPMGEAFIEYEKRTGRSKLSAKEEPK